MLCDFCVQMPEIMAFYHMVGNFNVYCVLQFLM